MSGSVAMALRSAARLDLGSPAIIAFGGVLGGFAAGSVARLRGAAPDRVARMATDGSWLGVGCGIVCYLATNLL